MSKCPYVGTSVHNNLCKRQQALQRPQLFPLPMTLMAMMTSSLSHTQTACRPLHHDKISSCVLYSLPISTDYLSRHSYMEMSICNLIHCSRTFSAHFRMITTVSEHSHRPEHGGDKTELKNSAYDRINAR